MSKKIQHRKFNIAVDNLIITRPPNPVINKHLLLKPESMQKSATISKSESKTHLLLTNSKLVM